MRKNDTAMSTLAAKLNPVDMIALKQMERIIMMSCNSGMEVVVFKPLSMSKIPLTAKQINTVQQLIIVQESVIRKTHATIPLDQTKIQIQCNLNNLNKTKGKQARLQYLDEHLRNHEHYLAIQSQIQNEDDADLFASKFYVLSKHQELSLLGIINKSKTKLTPAVEIVDQEDIEKTSPENNINTFTHVDSKLIMLVENQLKSVSADSDFFLVKFDRLAVKKILKEYVTDEQKSKWAFFNNECETLNLLFSKLYQRAPHSVVERYSDLFVRLNAILESTARKEHIDFKLGCDKFLVRAKLIDKTELSNNGKLFFLMSQEQAVFILELLTTAQEALSKNTLQVGLAANIKTKFPKMTKSASRDDCGFCFLILDKISTVIPATSIVRSNPRLESKFGWRLWATEKTDQFIATLNLQISSNLGSANLTSTITQCFIKQGIAAKRMRDGITHNSVVTVLFSKNQLAELEVEALIDDLDTSIKNAVTASNVTLNH